MADNDYNELLDQVAEQPGWRVDRIDSKRWRVLPPKGHGVIHVSESGDWRAFKNTISALRRAGFTPKDDNAMHNRTMKDAPPRIPPPQIVAVGHPEPDPIAIIRQEIDTIMNSLTNISEQLSKVEESGKGMEQLKSLLRTVIK